MSELQWFKSSYSANNGACVEVAFTKSSYSTNNGACVEVGFIKSSHSTNNGNCVEVAVGAEAVLARDSKNPDGGRLEFSPRAWQALTASLR
ncbi:DUF397 domain-containing protein [Saccharothrix obliqua]|uniref:DUF397 domain-containing protein n=1 Tax=Saccharothrix obliqua TaxID=2861747 RepID=UPI001C5FD18A|nr:DUF397 domain-containing protein [Saccharothrix obliqua]MBW4719116.1 DUF397 domain-containing protein [Saccharothrix obliqua]